MKNKAFSFCLIITLLCFGSCYNDPEESQGVQSLLISPDDYRPLEEIITDVSFIDFKLPEDQFLNFMGYWHKMAFTDDQIFLIPNAYDRTKIQLYSFDRSGNFIKSDEKKGQGPGELSSPSKMLIVDQQLIIVNEWSKLIYYDLDLNFIKEVDIPGDFFKVDFQHFNADQWIIASDIDGVDDEWYDAFKLIDMSSKSIESLNIRAHAIATEIIEGQVIKFKDSFLFNSAMADTIYSLRQGKVSPLIHLNMNNRNLPNAMKGLKESEEDMMKIISGNYAFNLGTLFTNNQHILLQVFALEKTEFDIDNQEELPLSNVFVNPATAKHVVTDMLVSTDFNGYFSDGEFFYFLASPEIVEYWINSNLLGKYTELLEAKINEMSDPEDPIMLRFKIANL